MNENDMKVKISYLGPAGTFSEAAAAAASKHFGLESAEMVAKPGIPAAAQIPAGDVAVLPYYNLLEGLVQESLDGIAYNKLTVVGLVRLPIVFWAGCSPVDAKLLSVQSHPKALGQCSEYIGEKFPNIPVVPVASTAASATAAKEQPGVIAIASPKAIKAANLNVLGEDVGNRRYGRQNFTDFLVTFHKEKMPVAFESAVHTHTLLLVAPEFDQPGLLAGILNVLDWHRLNLTKLHSRPSPVSSSAGAGEPQAFFIEIECSPQDERLTMAMASISGRLREVPEASVRILGGFSVFNVKEG